MYKFDFTRTLTRKTEINFLFTGILLFMSSCIYEDSYCDLESPIKVDLNLKISVDSIGKITLPEDSVNLDSVSKEYDVRYQVKVYKITEQSVSQTPSIEWVFLKDSLSDLNNIVKSQIAPGKYRVLVFADYVDKGSLKDKFYDTTNFNSITIAGKYQGNSAYREAFIGEQDINVAIDNADENGVVKVDIPMERPFARFNILATDVKEYANIYFGQKLSQSKSGETPILKSIEYGNYHAEISYIGYLPYEFDVFQKRPVDSKTGVAFKDNLRLINNETVQLGYDVVMVNGKESSVIVGFNIYDENNKLVSSVSNVQVPLKRGQLSTLIGKFLTNGTEPNGIGIKPDFDGEFNVNIN